MPQKYIEIFKGSPIAVMVVLDALNHIGISPVVKDPSASARLSGFGSLTSNQSLWVHKDEQQKAI
jgi:hypothetical protein